MVAILENKKSLVRERSPVVNFFSFFLLLHFILCIPARASILSDIQASDSERFHHRTSLNSSGRGCLDHIDVSHVGKDVNLTDQKIYFKSYVGS